MSISAEGKILEKIRSVLITDPIVSTYVNNRVYTEHISSIEKPVYPAISFHLLPGKPSIQIPDMVEINVQIDLWFDAANYTADDVIECNGAIRNVLHRQNLSDSSKGLLSFNLVQTDSGQMMFEQETKLRHYPSRYKAVII